MKRLTQAKSPLHPLQSFTPFMINTPPEASLIIAPDVCGEPHRNPSLSIGCYRVITLKDLTSNT